MVIAFWYAVQLILHVRRFRCLNPTCCAKTFAERLSDLIAPVAQRTKRLTAILRRLGLFLGGEAGARLGAFSGVLTSPDTLLRLTRQTPRISSTPKILGVDDWALRKGRLYGTLLIDGETHQPVDLLPERTAEAFASWLHEHPGVEVITRDRSTDYARGAPSVAPAAVQVADRWHLIRNLRQMLERLLERHRSRLQTQLVEDKGITRSLKQPPPISIYDRQTRRAIGDQLAQQQSRARRQDRYKQVKALHAQGFKIIQITRQLHLSRQSVRRYIASEYFPEQTRPPRRPSILDPYVGYLQERWDAGCHQSEQLWQEIKVQGYRGSIWPLVQWTMASGTTAG